MTVPSRSISREIVFYNLDVIISVGYRATSLPMGLDDIYKSLVGFAGGNYEREHAQKEIVGKTGHQQTMHTALANLRLALLANEK